MRRRGDFPTIGVLGDASMKAAEDADKWEMFPLSLVVPVAPIAGEFGKR